MPPQSSGFRRLGDPRWPDNDIWPDDDWPEDPHSGVPGTRSGISLAGGGPGRARGSGVRPLSLFLVAIVMCAISVVVTLWVTNDLSPTASTATGSFPTTPLQSQGGAPQGDFPSIAPAPTQGLGGGNLPLPGGGGNGGGGNGGGVPVIGGGGGGGIEMLMVGQVQAVTSNSITIAGSTHTLTAAVTRLTQISGRVHSISGIKVGDTVSAQITQSGGRPVATVIQDPASVPGGMP